MHDIAHRHAQHHTTHAERHDGEAAFDEIHQRHAYQQAEDYGQDEQRYRVPTAIADHDDQGHDDERHGKRDGEVVLHRTGVIIAACRCAVVEDAHVGMALLEVGDLCVEQVKHPCSRSRVGTGVARGDKGHAHRRVGGEEVAVLDLIAPAATHKRFHLSGQQRTQADGVGLDEFGIEVADLALKILAVLRHLPSHPCVRSTRPHVRRRRVWMWLNTIKVKTIDF